MRRGAAPAVDATEIGHGAVVFGPGVDRRVDGPSVSFVDLEPE